MTYSFELICRLSGRPEKSEKKKKKTETVLGLSMMLKNVRYRKRVFHPKTAAPVWRVGVPPPQERTALFFTGGPNEFFEYFIKPIQIGRAPV